jgi:hypothetical protein
MRSLPEHQSGAEPRAPQGVGVQDMRPVMLSKQTEFTQWQVLAGKIPQKILPWSR